MNKSAVRRFLKDQLEIALLIKNNWSNNYKYYGSLKSALACWQGTRKILRAPVIEARSVNAQIDCLTFSVIPLLGLIWARLISRVNLPNATRILVGDCSGSIHGLDHLPSNALTFPLLNYAHGQKLDLFMKKVCSSEFVLISDDDVFFLDGIPLLWGLEKMTSDLNTAVVSFVPRERFSWEVNGRKHQPMGSYCLLIRRELWLQEELSFRTVHRPSPNPLSYKGEYDTADFANIELLRRNYKIEIAPVDIQKHLLIFKGVSSFLIKAQAYPDNRLFQNLPIHAERALYLVDVIKKLRNIVVNIYPELSPNRLISDMVLENVERVLKLQLNHNLVTQITKKSEATVCRLSALL